MTKFVALKAFPYLGRRLKPGQAFEASDRDARLFLALRRAAPGEATQPDPAPAPEKRQRRPRRAVLPATQLVMDDPQPDPAPESETEPAPEPAPGLLGHPYATRHLVADSQ